MKEKRLPPKTCPICDKQVRGVDPHCWNCGYIFDPTRLSKPQNPAIEKGLQMGCVVLTAGLLIAFLSVVTSWLRSCTAYLNTPAPTLEQQYSGEWQDPTSDVMITLGRNSIRGCGEFYQKESKTFRGEYAVVCTQMPDGSGRAQWVGYLVWPRINKVEGPDYLFVYKVGGPPRPDPR